MIHQSLKTLIRYACHGWRMRLNVDTRDQAQTNLPMVGGNPTNLSRERIPGGMSAGRTGPGRVQGLGFGRNLALSCIGHVSGDMRNTGLNRTMLLTCNLIR